MAGGHMTVQHPEWKSCWPEAKHLLQSFRRVVDMSLYPADIVDRCISTDTGFNALSLLPVLSWQSMENSRSEMDLDAQEARFFGHLRPLKRDPALDSGAPGYLPSSWGQKAENGCGSQGTGEGSKGKGKNKGKGKGGQQLGPKLEQGLYPAAQMWASSAGSRSGMDAPWGREDAMSEYKSSEAHSDWLETKVQKLTQLVLRQEQTLASLRQDMVMHLFMKNGESGMVPVLCDTAAKWRITKEEEPGKLLLPQTLSLQTTADHVARAPLGDLQEAGSHGTCKVLGLDRQRPELDGIEVESRAAGSGGRHIHESGPYHGPALATGPDETGSQRGNPSSLPQPPPPFSGGQSGLDTVSTGDLASTRSSTSMVGITGLDRKSRVACSRLQTAPGQAELRFSGQRGLELSVSAKLSLKQLLCISLRNPTNLCYLNSTLLALTWTLLQARLCSLVHQVLVPELSFLTQVSTSRSASTLQVLNHLPLLTKLQARDRVHSQHDVAELVAYILPRLQLEGFEGSWEARRQVAGEARVTDTGSILAPVILALVPGEPNPRL